MSGGGDWYVLVERMRYGEWSLDEKVHVEGDREKALARAAELARGAESDKRGRQVFRTSETSWLVEVLWSYWDDNRSRTATYHLRLSVAELEYAKEVVPAEPPPKGRLRRAFGRD